MPFKYPAFTFNEIAPWRSPRLPIFTSAILFLLFFAACNSSGDDGHPKGTDSVSTQGSKVDSLNAPSQPGNTAALQVTGEPLFTYYTDATSMYNLIRKTVLGKARGKIVFQYLVNKTGALTLAAFGGERSSQSFDATRMVVLDNSTTVAASISNQLFLSDQEMSVHNYEKHDDITPLLDEIKKHPGSTAGKYEGYIAFQPSLIAFDVAPYQTIQYEVGWYATTDEINKQPHAFTAITGATLNPSPPRNSY